MATLGPRKAQVHIGEGSIEGDAARDGPACGEHAAVGDPTVGARALLVAEVHHVIARAGPRHRERRQHEITQAPRGLQARDGGRVRAPAVFLVASVLAAPRGDRTRLVAVAATTRVPRTTPVPRAARVAAPSDRGRRRRPPGRPARGAHPSWASSGAASARGPRAWSSARPWPVVADAAPPARRTRRARSRARGSQTCAIGEPGAGDLQMRGQLVEHKRESAKRREGRSSSRAAPPPSPCSRRSGATTPRATAARGGGDRPRVSGAAPAARGEAV